MHPDCRLLILQGKHASCCGEDVALGESPQRRPLDAAQDEVRVDADASSNVGCSDLMFVLIVDESYDA